MSDYPHITIDDEPLVVLTNQSCEDTGHWTPEQFEQLGLGYGEWNGENYPLTDEEVSLVGEHNLNTPLDGDLMFGYSALFQGKKWIMSTIEYEAVALGHKPTVQRRGQVELERKAIQKLVDPYQGRAIYDDGREDRITVLVLVPMEIMLETFGYVNVWMRYLERGLGIKEKE